METKTATEQTKEKEITFIPDRNRINFALEKLEGILDLMYAIKDGLDRGEAVEGKEEEEEMWAEFLKHLFYFWAQAVAVLVVKAEYIDKTFREIESGEKFEHFMKSDIPDDLKKIFGN